MKSTIFTVPVIALLGCLTQPLLAATTTTNGQISEPGERDRFTFHVDAEKTYYFDALTDDGQLRWTLSGPRGLLVDRRSFANSDAARINAANVLLPLVPGDYTLTVDATSGSTLPYAFRLVDLADATLLTPGAETTATLNPARSTALYQFTAAAGDQVRIDVVSQTNFNGRIRLLGPLGQVWIDRGATDSETETLDVSGNYTLLVEGDLSTDGAGSVVFKLDDLGNVPPPALTGTPFNLGATVSSSIPAEGGTNNYTLQLAAPVFVSMDSLQPAPGVTWSLRGPDGLVANRKGLNNSDGYNGISLLRLSAGTHQVQIIGNAAADYSFRLIDLAAAPVLTASTPAELAQTTGRETKAYRFNAVAGSRWFYSFLEGNTSGNTSLRFIDPFGGVAYETGSRNQYGPITFNFTGTWTLLFEGYLFESPSERSQQFVLLPVQDGLQAMSIGAVVEGAVASPGQTQRHTFTLTAPRSLLMDALIPASYLTWSLSGPGGFQINPQSFQGDDPSTANFLGNMPPGDYTMVINGSNERTNSYRFRLLDRANATEISANSAVTGELNPGSEMRLYRFTAPAGTRMFFDALESNTRSASWVLRDRFGHQIFYTGLSQDQFFTLDAGGEYELWIHGYIYENDTVPFSFVLKPVTDTTEALTIGATVNGGFTTPGQSKRYTFNLAAARRLYFDALLPANYLRWRLDGPTGTVFDWRSFNGSDAQSGRSFAELPAGNYVLTVNTPGDHLEDYRFRLLDMATSTSIAIGDSITGQLDPAVSTKFFKFNATAGARLFFDQTSGLTRSAMWRLLAPDGSEVFFAGLGQDRFEQMPQTGSYTLLIEGYIYETELPQYAFEIHPVTDGNQTLTLGTTVSGALAEPGQKQIYSFNVATTTRVYFDSLTSAAGIRWSLNGPQGTLVNRLPFSSSDGPNGFTVRTLVPGSYTLSVEGDGDAAASYGFRLLNLADATPLNFATATNGRLEPANRTDQYKFTAAAGDRFTFDTTTPQPRSSYWRLVGPNSDLIFTLGLGSDSGLVTLAAAGTYTLFLEGYIFEGEPVDYQFQVVPQGNSPITPYSGAPLTLGTLVVGNLAAAADSSNYVFTVNSPTTVQFDSQGASSQFHATLRRRTDGNSDDVLYNNYGFDSLDYAFSGVAILRLAPGSYQLTVGGFAGEYRFRLLNADVAPLLTLGTEVIGTNTPASANAIYRLVGQAGDELFLKGGTISGFTSTPYGSLWLPTGERTSLADLYLASYHDVFRLPVSGTYYWLVTSSGNESGPEASFRFNFLPVSNPTNNFALGETVNSQIASPGQTRHFRFNVPTASVITLDALTYQDEMTVSLTGPSGLIFENRAFWAFDYYLDPASRLLRLPAGDYQLTFSANRELTPSFSFRAIDTAGAPTLTAGTVFAGTATPAAATSLAAFTGTAGDKFFLRTRRVSGWNRSPIVTMFTPSGVPLVNIGLGGRADTFTLPETGRYLFTVISSSDDDGASGLFELELLPVTSSTVNLVLGATQTGDIASAGQSYAYNFTLPTAKRLHFDLLGGDGNIQVKLNGPAGEQTVQPYDYYQGQPWVDVAAGDNVLTIRRNSDETGPFSFRLLDFASATPFTPGDEVSSVVTPANATVIRSFPGVAGARYYFDGRGSTGGTRQPIVQLVSPAGNSIFRVGVNSDVDTFTLGENGTYSLLVLGEPSDSAASLTALFRLVPNPENPSIPIFENSTAPDLVVSQLSTTPSSGLTTGNSLQVNWTVRNTGTAPVNRSFTDRVTLRHRTSGVLLDTRVSFDDFGINGPLAPNATRNRTLTLHIPDGPDAAGSLEVTAVADTLNNVAEGNEVGTAEANNGATTPPLTVSLAPYPDLRVANVTATPPGEWAPGSSITLNWRTTNAGPRIATAPWSERVVVRNQTVGRVVANLTTNVAANLASLGNLARTLTFALPNNNDAYGQFEITVTTDEDEAVFEYLAGLDAEANNVGALSVLNEAPALSLNLPANRLAEGDSMEIAVTRRPVSASPLIVQLTSSADDQFTVPGTVVIPAGQPSVTFDAVAVDDAFVERTNNYVLTARSTGFRDASATVAVEDNDHPVVTLSLASATVSEGAGPNATSATLTRTPVTPRPVTIGLTSANPAAAKVPNSVTIPANQASVSFPVAAVDNANVDGTRNVALGGFVLDSFTFQQLYEIAPAVLAVTDNDGATLTLRIAADLVGEGLSPATTATVTRNTATTGALAVNLASSDTTEATVPPTVTIPAGEPSVTFPIASLNDGQTDGNQTVTITASAAGFTAGTDTVVVSDADLPDLVINNISFATNAVTDGNLAITFRLENRGLRTATAAVTQRVFLSSDNLAGSDTLVAQVVFDGPLPVGQLISQTVNVRLPETPGTFYVVVQADATNAQAEALENNNTLVSAATVTTTPAYGATVSTDVTTALAGTPVALHGFATRGDGSRAPNEHVTVHVKVRGTTRQIEVVTDAAGDFTTTFHPLPGEAGHYLIAAAYPGLPMPATQDEFSLLGLEIISPGFITVTEGSTYNGSTRVRNLSDVALTGLVLEVLEHDPSLNVTATLETNKLAGDDEIVLNYAITPVNRTVVQSGVRLRITTAEGATDQDVFTVRQEFLRPQLVTSPARLNSSMLRGGQTIVSFNVRNSGGLATGPMEVLLPNLPWLGVSTPAHMAPLAPGDSATVSLLLTPPTDLPLGDYPGNLVLSAGNTALTVPFEFRAISDNRGNLVLTAEDEYTYFAADHPRVTNALVVLTDALSGVAVRTNVTGSDGLARFTNLVEAQYIVDVKADKHSTFRQTALVPAGGTTNVVAFLPRETVRYTFTVTPTTIEDRYAFTVESTFETQVPVPVVTIEPASLDIANRPEAEFQVNYTIRNHGLIAANNVKLRTVTGGRIEWIPLINEIGRLDANATIVVPVTIRRVQPAPAGRNDFRDGRCSVTAGMIWDYLCGPNVVDKETATYTFDSTGCDLVDLYRQVYDVVPIPGAPSIPNDHPCQDPATFYDCLDQFQPVIGFEPPPGFKFQCKDTRPGSSVGPAPLGIHAARAGLPRRAADASNEVCAKVKLRLDQRAVLTRDAFNALLEIENDTTSAIEDILVTLNIVGEDGSSATAKFGIREPVLAGLSAVNGTGTIGPKTTGSASWILIPSLDAAPTNGVALFLVGGTLSYSQDGSQLSIPLAPAPIQVYPQPELLVRYFHQRDVFADDPFTPEVEASIPYSLAVQILNQGYGAARNLKLSSGKPQITENEKGLLIEFKTVGTQLENQALTPSLDVDFGEIGIGTNRIARWLFTSSLQGSFTDYSAKFEHLDSLGTKRLSLVKGVEIYELVRIVNADRQFDDARPDFLISPTNDPNHLPHALFLSNGGTNAVTSHTNVGVSGVLSAANKRVTLTAALGSGWSYLRVPDPAGNDPFVLKHVLRGDGTEIAFGTNAWTTDRIFRGGDKRPIVINLVHILDYNSTGTYTLVYDEDVVVPPDTTAPNSSVTALPPASGNTFTVTWNGTDDRGPVAFFDVFVSTDNGPYAPLVERTGLTGTVFSGQAGRHYRFYAVATDAAGNRETIPATADAETVVSVANRAPSLAYPAEVAVDEGNAANATAVASDPDGDALAFTLVSGPVGVIVNPATGFVTWPTSESDGPSTNTVRIRVTDNGTPPLGATNEFRVIVRESNATPELAAIADAVISENNLFTLQLHGADGDLPQQALTYGLAAGAPQGVTVDSATGELKWRPRGNQGPSTNEITVTLTDSGSPARSVQRTFRLYVRDTAADLAVTAGRTNLLAGEAGAVGLTLAAGPELDGLTFVLSGDVARLGELALANLAGDVTGVQVIPRPDGDAEMRFTLTGGSLSASRPLAAVTFTTPAAAPSGAVALAFSELVGTAADNYVTKTASSPGRVIVVNEDAVLDFTSEAATPLHLYGRPGIEYHIERSPVVGTGAVWTPVQTLTPDERLERLPATLTGTGGYFRALRD